MATETIETFPETGFYWHVHHDRLLEWCTSYTERREYIQREKPQQEQELRLRLFRPVRASLPDPLTRARAELDKAWAKWNRNRADSLPQLETIHQAECPNCPWNGHTIFPDQEIS